MKLSRAVSSLTLAWTFILLFSLPGFADEKKPAELNIEAQLIWGTNDTNSPNSKHKAIEPSLAKKLSESPFKWKNYFEEERKCASIAQDQKTKLVMSSHCTVEVKNLGADRIEVVLFGDGKAVVRKTDSLAHGKILLIGGDAKNDTAWFVVLKKIETKK
jgi:hypothetical protein